MNIGDIAEMAGVSRAAVSRYLNNGYISKEKRERIRKVIEETGYRPSVMAQILRTKKTHLAGVVLPRIHSDSISAVVAGIGHSLNAAGYDMLLATTDNQPEKELDFLRIFSNDRVDGIIILATVITEEHRQILNDMKIPVVIAGQTAEGYCCVSHDDYNAGKQLTERLLAGNRRKIAYIGVRKDDIAVGLRRYEGYLSALKEAGIEPPPESYETADFSRESGAEAMRRLLQAYPEPDAVLAATDSIATGAMYVLQSSGRRVPEDVAIAGFGDNVISGVTTPGLTTAHFHYRECGEIAALKLVERIEGNPDTDENVVLGFEIIERASV